MKPTEILNLHVGIWGVVLLEGEKESIGLWTELSFGTTAHGAGRFMSRAAAKRGSPGKFFMYHQVTGMMFLRRASWDFEQLGSTETRGGFPRRSLAGLSSQ